MSYVTDGPAGSVLPPDHCALLLELLDLVAGESLPADRLAQTGAARFAALIGDTCLVSVRSSGELQPVAVADTDPEAAAVLAPLIGRPLAPDRRVGLTPYVARFGLASDVVAPMRSRGRVVGEVVALRRRRSRPFTPQEVTFTHVVADVLGMGLAAPSLPVPVPGVPTLDALTGRERQVLALLALGHTNREIALQVHLSVRTVEWHRARIQSKLGITGRAALARVARTHGLLAGTDRHHED